MLVLPQHRRGAARPFQNFDRGLTVTGLERKGPHHICPPRPHAPSPPAPRPRPSRQSETFLATLMPASPFCIPSPSLPKPCTKLELPWASRPEDSWPGGPDSFVVLSVFSRRARPGTEYNRSAGFMHASVKVFSNGFHTQSETAAYAPADCVTALRSGVQRRVECKPSKV